MMNLHSVALAIHVAISAMIIGLVLLQRGKGAEAGAAFGSGASGTVFGAKGSANFMSRTTGILAAGFFMSSLGRGRAGRNRDDRHAAA
jgi:preprotein translocase subunit SecG